MPFVNAICDVCGTAWHVRTFFGPGVISTGTKYSPCPNCGGEGTVPDFETDKDGELRFLDRAREILSDPQTTQTDVQFLLDFIRTSLEQKTEPEQVVATAEQRLGVFGSLLRLAKPTNPTEFWTMMTVLVPLLVAFLLRSPEQTVQAVPDIQNNITLVVEQPSAVHVVGTPSPSPLASVTPSPSKKARQFPPKAVRQAARAASRACQCGSGKLFMECCGKMPVSIEPAK